MSSSLKYNFLKWCSKRCLTLNLKDFRAYEQKQKEFGLKFDAVHKPVVGFTAENLSEDIVAVSRDSVKIRTNKDWLKDIAKDEHLYETVEIMKDLIQSMTGSTAATTPVKEK